MLQGAIYADNGAPMARVCGEVLKLDEWLCDIISSEEAQTSILTFDSLNNKKDKKSLAIFSVLLKKFQVST